ncbi:beta-galactosidase small subunit [Paenibacillus sp. TRM 82003]|nr:beta-galactosidase small subunit [Kineococcus sp. TRM81007]MCI3924077.1 beta-galactosidase small subunit [Paenibacillus sp. TRM 82003]
MLDARTGALRSLGGLAVEEGPVLDLFRAPTDNDAGLHGEALEKTWRQLGLDRLRTRTASAAVEGEEFVVTTRTAAAGTDTGFVAVFRWSADTTGAVRLAVEFTPEVPGGPLGAPLPRLGVRLRLPHGLDAVTWFGRGPGEAYADTGTATRVGLFTASVEELQTPYVRPQENGRRADARWAELRGPAGGLRVEGEPHVAFAARRWSTAELDAATHTPELADSGSVHLHLDVAQHGIGTGSCGPGALPQHRLEAEPRTFSLVLRPLG